MTKLLPLLLSLLAGPALCCTVAIDIGHGPKHSGAQSARGVPEYRFNRAMGDAVMAVLRERGIAAAPVNPQGVEMGLAARTGAAARSGADLLVSLHHDSAQLQRLSTWVFEGKERLVTESISGYSLFVSAKGRSFARSQALARQIGERLLAGGFSPSPHHAEPIKGENRPWIDPRLGIYRFDDLVVLKTATMPAVLVECGVIVNKNDETRLLDPGYRRRIAESIAEGVARYCGAVPAAPGRAPGAVEPMSRP
jgi:N-acetylmuramoyl-L-alanine amidase